MNVNSKNISSSIVFFIAIAAVIITLWGMKQAAPMLSSLILSIIIVASFTPLMQWLQRKGVPGWLAYTLTLIAIFAVFTGLVAFMIVAVNRFIEAIPTYAAQLESTIQRLEQAIASLGIARFDVNAIFDLINPGRLLQLAAGFLGGLIGAFSNIALVVLIIIFLLIDAMSLQDKLEPYIQRGNQTVTRFYDFGSDLRQYVIITTIVGLVTGIFDTILFLIMGVDFAVLWGILAFLLSYIPTLGFWLAAIPPTFLALLESGPMAALIVFLGIVLINGAAENIVKPRYMGKGLDLSPFVVVFSVIFWSAILGAIGSILAVPVTMAFKTLILQPDPANNWLAGIMSAEPHPIVDAVTESPTDSSDNEEVPPD